MPTKSSLDFTGSQAQRLADARKQELSARAEKMTMVAQATIDAKDEVVSLVGETPSEPVEVDGVVAIVEAPETEVVRMAEDCLEFTYGRGNTYDLRAGYRYELPKHVAQHLRTLGRVYDRG